MPKAAFHCNTEDWLSIHVVQDIDRCELKKLRVPDLLCMSHLAHASPTKELDDNDYFQGTTGRAAWRR